MKSDNVATFGQHFEASAEKKDRYISDKKSQKY